MFLSWYEKERDQKEHIYFVHRSVYQGWKQVSDFPCFHNSLEFAVGLKGRVKIVIGGESHYLEPGEICFIDSLQPHRYCYENETECYIVIISASFYSSLNQLGEISFPAHMKKCAGFEHIKEFLSYIEGEWDASDLLCKTAFADRFAYLMKKYYPYTVKYGTDKKGETLLDAIKYISENCTQELTVDAVAARFSYSVNYFSTMFNKFVGSSFRDFLNVCRIVEYEQLRKQDPTLTVAKAAEMCGFGSTNTFYRAYKKYLELG